MNCTSMSFSPNFSSSLLRQQNQLFISQFNDIIDNASLILDDKFQSDDVNFSTVDEKESEGNVQNPVDDENALIFRVNLKGLFHFRLK